MAQPSWWQIVGLINLVWLYVYSVFLTDTWGHAFAVVGIVLLIAAGYFTFGQS